MINSSQAKDDFFCPVLINRPQMEKMQQTDKWRQLKSVSAVGKKNNDIETINNPNLYLQKKQKAPTLHYNPTTEMLCHDK